MRWVNIFTIIILFCNPGLAQDTLLATIDDTVKTDFGTYDPYHVNFEAEALQYEVEPDFSNVINFENFEFNETERDKLLQNHFVVINGTSSEYGTGYKEIYDIYSEARDKNLPQFVTTDACLHTFHKLYDKLLRTAEQEHFVQDLITMDSLICYKAIQEYDSLNTDFQRQCFRKVIAYFSVPLAIMKGDFVIPEMVKDTVTSELDLLNAHHRYVRSPLFQAYEEDYSQYKPRGHYTLNLKLERYFKAMMWHGRQTFVLNNNLTGAALYFGSWNNYRMK
ncbi:MAG: DUF3160 domain-containing protein [Candidatus Marinimicrobia bacterium]|nr:DUF3160 domain-containing protein [Candidatus Neomarinimicrobiota bacterium]